MRRRKKKSAYRQQLSAYAIVFTSRCLSVLPIAIASAIAGKIVRFFGPFSREHKIGDANLQRFLPHISPDGRREILAGMWENIGRAFGEMPHLDKILNDPTRFSFDGLDNIVAELAEGQGAVTVTGHFGNWELSPAPSYRLGRRQVSFYRKPRNPHLEQFLLR